MKPPRCPTRILAIFVLMWCPTPGAFSASTEESADTRWALIEADSREIMTPATAPETDRLIALADRLRDFRLQNQRHPAVAEAKQREAAVLVQAAFLGEVAQDARLGQLVSEIRGDRSLDASIRLQLAASVDNLAVERRADLSAEERLDEFERVARALQTEFPDVAQSYASLLAVARAQPESKGIALAREIVGMTGVPGESSLQATDYVSRCELVGRLFLEVIAARDPDGLVDLKSTDGLPVVFYSWSPDSAYSQWLAAEIAKFVGEGVVVIGLRLPETTGAAPPQREQPDLPGVQFDASSEVGGIMRWALRLNEPGLVYVANERGMIQSICAQNNLSAHLAALAAR